MLDPGLANLSPPQTVALFAAAHVVIGALSSCDLIELLLWCAFSFKVHFVRFACVAGVHGAALANTLFCTEGTILLELSFRERFAMDYRHLALGTRR